MVKDPTTGKRVSRPNPPEKHKRSPAPHLRIVSNELWEAARNRRRIIVKPVMHRVPRMLSGLLKCPSCGGGMGSVGLHRGEPRVQCSTYRESGSCSNSRMVNRNKIELAVLDGLRDLMNDPKYWQTYLTAFNERFRELASGAVRDKGRLERRAGEIKRETDRLVDAIASGTVPADVVGPKLKALEAERQTIEQGLAAAREQNRTVAIHPASIKAYLRDVEAMRDALERRDDASLPPELIAPLRRLVHSVVVHAEPGVRGDLKVEIKGRLQELIGAPFLQRSMGGGPLVAGEGLEPPTPGL